MRLLTKGDLVPRAVTYRNLDGDTVVRLRCGPLWYELAPGEAADLARELSRAAKDANDANRDTDEHPENQG
jgi:hypothetical protein